MFAPWQMGRAHPLYQQVPMMRMPVPIREIPGGAFPVPESMSPDCFPPEVKAAIMRLIAGPPKPAVTLAVMNQTQWSMIAPDLPFKANV
jgi:hypothetical protein